MDYTTITLSLKTKKALEKLKGERTWDEFLLEMAAEYRKARAERAREYIRKYAVTEEEEAAILSGIEEDRELWK
ncbi:MAG: hypothetical protein QXW47_03160 [Candidatus Jordarchaeales archaeon]|nr:hypothetical protein [Candidatus Jordarchaeia archaeon]